MDTLYTAFIVIFGIIFLVSLIEYLTGAEREGIKFFAFFFIFLLIISFLLTLKTSEKTSFEKLSELIAGIFDSFFNFFKP